MFYASARIDGNLIELHNSIWGEETVKVNGQMVSKKSSFLGTEHFFNLINDNGSTDRYIVKSKMTDLTVGIDIYRNGIPIIHNLVLGENPKNQNKYKKEGIKFLNDYKLNEALTALLKAADIDSEDAEIPLYLACIYSIKEDAENGFKYLALAAEKKLSNLSAIDTLDHLAYLRLHCEFESFKASGYKNFQFEKDAK